jgi:RND superfamily putative drug exporter
VVLPITFGSLVAAGLPLLTAGVGVGAGMLGIQVASGFFELSSSTAALATMLGLAAGIDYALFVVSRYRHESAEHDGEEAAGRAVGTAGSAVVFAGLTEGHFAEWLGAEGAGPIVSIMPIFLIGILFGLAMDYEVFLVTRPREEFVHGAAPDAAVVSGMRHGARVVTAAALIMMSVFAGFILADDTIIKSLGFALAFGVAVDAFLVRMTVVPAVLSLLGRSAWWLPRWLDRLLPDVDVEGSRLVSGSRVEAQLAEDLRDPAVLRA